MREELIDLCSALRFDGVPVSLAESLEAAHLLSMYPAMPKEVIRLVLLICLVKAEGDLPAFLEQFERWWQRWFQGAAHEPVQPLAEIIPQLRQAVLQGETQKLEALIASAVSQGRSLSAADAAGGLSNAFRQAAANRKLYDDFMNSFALEQLTTDIEGDPDLGIWQRQQARNALNTAGALLRKAVFSPGASEGSEYARRFAMRMKQLTEDISDISIARASHTQIQSMQVVIPEIVRKLSHRRKYQMNGRQGVLLFRKTMRSSLSHGGVPLELVFKRRSPKQERIALLCDLSGSVEQFSMFTLQLANLMSRQFAGVRCFGFVSDIDDITRFVSRSDFPSSMRSLFRQCSLVYDKDNSNYGHVLRQFVRKFLGDLGGSTSVIVLGDARTNGLDPAVDALRVIRSRVKELHWLNPEPKESWGIGDNVMNQYMEVCDSTGYIRTVHDLAEFMTSLGSRRA